MVWDWVNYVNLHSDPGETNRTDPTVCQVTSAPLTAHLVLTWRTSQPEVRKGGKRCSKNPPPRRQNCSKNGTLASLTNVFVVSHCCFDILRFFFKNGFKLWKHHVFAVVGYVKKSQVCLAKSSNPPFLYMFVLSTRVTPGFLWLQRCLEKAVIQNNDGSTLHTLHSRCVG